METRQEAIRQLRILAQGEENLFLGNDDTVLLVFLFAQNFDVKKAFEQMTTWFRLKAEYSTWFAQRKEPVHDRLNDCGLHVILENRDQLGRRIFIIKIVDLQSYSKEFVPEVAHQLHDMWVSLALHEEETRRNGMIIIVDLKEATWKLLKLFTPTSVTVNNKKSEATPIAHIQCHYVNGGSWINAFARLMVPFINSKDKQQMFFHKSHETLHEHVSPSALPVDYGGQLESPDIPKIVQNYVNSRSEVLNKFLSYGYKKK